MRERRNSTRFIVGATVSSLLVQAIQIVVGIVSVPILLKTLGDQEYSMLATLWILPSFLPFFDLGLPRSLAKYVALADDSAGRMEDYSLLWVTCFLQGTVFVIIGGIWFAWTLAHVDKGNLSAVPKVDIYLFLGATVCVSIINIFASYLQGRGELIRLFLLNTTTSLSIAFVPLIALFTELNLHDVATWTLIARIAAVLLGVALVGYQWLIAIALLSKTQALSHAKQILSLSGKSVLYFIASPALVFGERFISAWMMPGVSIMQHLVATDLSLKCLLVPAITSQYSFRAIADSGKDPSGFDVTFRNYLNLMGCIYLLPIFLGISFSKELLSLWLGNARVNGNLVLSTQLAFAAVASCGVTIFLVQTALIRGTIQILSGMVVVQSAVYFGIVIMLLYWLGSPESISNILSLAWSGRVIVDGLIIVLLCQKKMFNLRVHSFSICCFFVLPVSLAFGINCLGDNGFKFVLTRLIILVPILAMWAYCYLRPHKRSAL